MALMLLLVHCAGVVASVGVVSAAAAPRTQPKSIDFYANFPARVTDFLVGNNSRGWANTTSGFDISKHTGTVYQCCNGFLLGADGMQAYLHSSHAHNATDSWGQSAFVAAGKPVMVNIDPQTNATVSASDCCSAALARKEAYAQELITIATREKLGGFVTDWEDATGNNMTCFNALFGYVSKVLKPHGLAIAMSMDNSNHQGPMDSNSTEPWSAEWDWLDAVSWSGALIDMGTYPGGWSKGLSFPAAQYLHSYPCPKYPQKTCGLEGQVLDMLKHGVNPNGQLSPGIAPNLCSVDGLSTSNGWTKASLTEFLEFLDTKQVRTVTLWFSNALQLFADSYTCPWFIPTLAEWAEKA